MEFVIYMKMGKLNQVADFDIKLLKIFKVVCESGSFTAAESVLGMSRSAISLHMADLENRLGMRLCQRGRAGFAVTQEGEEILKYVEVLMAAIEDFRIKANQVQMKLKGEFNIGIINNLVTMPSSYITQSLQQLSQESSEVHINISMSTLSDIECKIMDGRLHVGAIPLMTRLSGLNYFDLYEEKSYLYCGQNHPLFSCAEQLKPDDLLHSNTVMPSYSITPQALKLHQRMYCNATASDREGIAFLILTGNFLGFLPDHFAKKWVMEGQMKALFTSKFHYSTRICAVTKKGVKHNMILAAFFEKIKLNMAEQPLE
ncbi:DNA-binding transcriptional LysR family regulator [Acinetobacter calcoaceticus]|uniref:DNA-binding transcriptional LysR family regulator n=1 Tax=Acinetobacter calcoaceticus TaxID=471 RepID=A0A4R1XT17_ACICA|nr:DNA-binding transcriptional LysR family regulator [Acinetobacter calcoaceticus]